MNEELKTKALKTLETNPLFNIDIIEPIKRGFGKIIYAGPQTVLVHEIRSKSYMLYSENAQKGLEILSQQDKTDIQAICLHQEALLEEAKKQFNFENHISCYQTANLEKTIVKVPDTLEIKTLDLSYKQIIANNYHNCTLEELHQLLEEKQIFGGFKNGTLVGFIGIHLEGSCGLLEIFPEHRKKGYGTILEGYLNNHVIQQGNIPFGQIVDDNQKSLALQKKLGMNISKEKIYWAF